MVLLLRRAMSRVVSRIPGHVHLSSTTKATPEIHKNRLSKQLTLRSVVQSTDRKPRDLVLFYEWLYPNAKAVDKYCMLYHENGFDVLTIKGQMASFVWPPVSVKLSQEILAFLKNKRNPITDKYIIHAFSIGAYNFTTCSMISSSQSSEFGFFRENIRGQIFDSVVAGSYDHMVTGICESLSVPRPLRKPFHLFMDSFFMLTKKKTTDVYDQMVAHFWGSVAKVPTLVFYSENDPMCDATYVTREITQWKEKQLDVTSVSWKKSIHAAHLKEHPQDYMREWNKLMNKLGTWISTGHSVIMMTVRGNNLLPTTSTRKYLK